MSVFENRLSHTAPSGLVMPQVQDARCTQTWTSIFQIVLAHAGEATATQSFVRTSKEEHIVDSGAMRGHLVRGARSKASDPAELLE